MTEMIQILAWTEEDFLSREAEWQSLLQRSSGDSLFGSWYWLTHWWRCHRKVFSLELKIYAAYQNERLVGIAPFSMRRYSHKGLLTKSRLELLGQLWREPESVMSEYLDVLIDDNYVEVVEAAFIDHLIQDADWDELVAANTRDDSVVKRVLKMISPRLDCHLRETDALVGYAADLSMGSENYIRELKSGVRRKVIGHRKRLTEPQFQTRTEHQLPEAFDIMDEFHTARWGSIHMSGIRRDFHREFARHAAERNCLELSFLISDGEPLSVLYNLKADSCEYNIQSAFSPRHASGISPNYLHLGFSIESAANSGTRLYHLLAGTGRKRDFKPDLCDQAYAISTMQLIRDRLLKRLYRVHGLIQKIRQ